VVLYSFLATVQIALLIGYGLGLRLKPRLYRGAWSVPKLVKFALALNLIWIVPTFLMRSGAESASLTNVFNTIFGGILDPGQAYQSKQEATAAIQETSVIAYATQIISPILWLMTPLCVYYWGKLPRTLKALFAFAVFTDILIWMAIGTNKGIFDLALMVPFIFLASKPHLIAKVRGQTLIKFAAIVLIIGGLLFIQFSTTQKSRGGGEAFIDDSSAGISLNYENWLLAPFPDDKKASAGALMSYMTQGYYPLSLALTEPFVFSYGVGNSYYYTGIVQSFTGPNTISDLTYPARIERYGWDRWGRWHSIYPWVASDISFIGVPFFVGAIGWLLAAVWRESLAGTNPFAIALLALLVIMIFYFPANNQVLAFSRTANAFFVLLFMWAYTRMRGLR